MVETINAILHTFHSPRFKPWAIGIRETTKGCAIIEKDSIAHLRRAMKFFVYSCYRYLPPTAAFMCHQSCPGQTKNIKIPTQ
jgi:hypothetical protein